MKVLSTGGKESSSYWIVGLANCCRFSGRLVFFVGTKTAFDISVVPPGLRPFLMINMIEGPFVSTKCFLRIVERSSIAQGASLDKGNWSDYQG